MESNVILEDYCSYEVAKLLKQKGFPFDRLEGGFQRLLNLNVMEAYTTVTHAIARKWLRKKGIDIFVGAIRDMSLGKRYEANVHKDMVYQGGSHTVKATYEEAVEAELKFCLTEIL